MANMQRPQLTRSGRDLFARNTHNQLVHLICTINTHNQLVLYVQQIHTISWSYMYNKYTQSAGTSYMYNKYTQSAGLICTTNTNNQLVHLICTTNTHNQLIHLICTTNTHNQLVHLICTTNTHNQLVLYVLQIHTISWYILYVQLPIKSIHFNSIAVHAYSASQLMLFFIFVLPFLVEIWCSTKHVAVSITMLIDFLLLFCFYFACIIIATFSVCLSITLIYKLCLL